MNVKTVVKVMNFHALLRVDASRRDAEKLGAMEHELLSMMRIILNNKNLLIDQRIKIPDKSLPILRIYIGSDFGFCGSVNSAVSKLMLADSDTSKIAIGKKLRRGKRVELFLNQEDVEKRFSEIQDLIGKAIYDEKYSAIELVYNHYYNMSNIRTEVKRIYPLELDKTDEEDPEVFNDDFMVEDLPSVLFKHMTANYLCLELKIAMASSYASENALRQSTTQESLKKLDEKEFDDLRIMRKKRTLIAVSKTIDSYIMQKAIRRVTK